MSDDLARLMEVRDEGEGESVCARLRAAGIKCAVEPLPDDNSWYVAVTAVPAPDALFVLVHESDLPRARDALRARP